MFVILVNLYGLSEAKYWAETLGLKHKEQYSRMVNMKPEYREGPEARKKFEEGMTKLFRAKKPSGKETPKATPKRKQGKASKG